jgi:hypothetical protein
VPYTATFDGNFQKLDKAVTDANQKMEAFEISVKGVQRQLQTMVSSLDGSKIVREATIAAAAVEKIGGATKLTEAETKRYNATITEAVAKMNALGQDAPEAWKKIAAETEKAAKAAEGVGAGTKKAGDSMLSLGGIAKMAGGALAGAFTIGAVVNFGKEVIDLAGDISDTSARLKISTSAVQEFKYGLEQTGSSIDTLTGAMEQMGNRLTEGGTGTIAAVQTLGLSLEELRGMAPEDAFTAIADAIKEVPEPMRQTQLAMELLGKSGTEMLPAIRAGMSDLRQEARDLGQVMSEDAVEGLDTLGDTWGKFIGRAKAGVGELISDIAKAAAFLEGLGPKLPAGQRSQGDLFGGPGALGQQNRDLARQMDEREREIEKALNNVKSPAMFGAPAGFTANTPSAEEQDRANKAQRQAVETALAHAKAIKTLADSFRSADLTKQVQMMGQAFATLTPAERANADITKNVVEEYGKLRTQVGQGALPRELEAFYLAHLTVIDGTKQLLDVTGRYATAVLPDLSRRVDEARNMLAGLTADGLIPTTKAFANLYDKMQTPNAGPGITTGTPPRRGAGVDAMVDYAGYFGGGGTVSQLANTFRTARQTQKELGKFGVGSQMFTGSTANRLAATGTAAIGVAEGAQDVWAATDKAGAGERALGGALAGAKAGAMFGPYGMAIGAAAGLVIGLVRGKPEWAKAADEVGRDFGVKISAALGKEIAKTAKELFKGDRSTAAQFHLGDIIKEGGGVNDLNFDKMTAKLRDTFSFLERGQFSKEQARKVIDENFQSFADHVLSSTHLASKGFQELFELNKRFGLESAEMRKFVEGQTSALGSSIAALAGPLSEKYDGLSDSIAEAKKEVAALSSEGREGTEEYASAVENLTILQNMQKEAAIASADELERLGVIAVGAFNAAIAGGMGYVQAVEAMGPALDQLINIQKNLGIETSNTALAELTSFRDRVNGNKTLVMAAEALGETMRALASIGGLNNETLAAMEVQGVQTFDRLKAAGFSENQALMMMKGFLENVQEGHEQLGTPIDENTQKLIDQAKEAGILKDKTKSGTDIMERGFDKVTGAVGLLAKALGVDVPAAIQETIDRLNDIPRDIDVNVNVNANGPSLPEGSASDPNASGDGSGLPGAARGIYATGASGVATWFGEAGAPELGGPVDFMGDVLSHAIARLGVDRGGGSNAKQEIHIHLEADGREFAHAVVPFIPGVLAMHGLAR